MSADSFDPHSPNAMFATILERVDSYGRQMAAGFEAGKKRMDALADAVGRVEAQTTKTNGRVNAVEAEKLPERMSGLEIDVAALKEIKAKGQGAWWMIGIIFGGLSFAVAIFEAMAIWIKG